MTTFPESLMTNDNHDNHDNHDNEGGVAMHIKQPASLEIAELTGKQHFHVMEAIRKMEPAWKKIAERKFALGSLECATA